MFGLTYERTVSSGLQPYFLSRLQFGLLHLCLGVPEGPGPVGAVFVGNLQQLRFVHRRWQPILRETVRLAFSFHLWGHNMFIKLMKLEDTTTHTGSESSAHCNFRSVYSQMEQHKQIIKASAERKSETRNLPNMKHVVHVVLCGSYFRHYWHRLARQK